VIFIPLCKLSQKKYLITKVCIYEPFNGRSGESHLKRYSLIYCIFPCCDYELHVDLVDSETQGPPTSSFIHDNFSLQHRLMKLEDV